MTNKKASLKLKQFDDSVDATEEVKPKSKPKTVRGCIFEVCQDLAAFDTVPDFSKCAESTGAVEHAWLIHGCDVYDEDDQKALKAKGLDISKYPLGAPKNDHVHVVMRFKNPTSLPKIAKAFGVPEQNVQRWSGANAWNNALSYLTHRTASALFQCTWAARRAGPVCSKVGVAAFQLSARASAGRTPRRVLWGTLRGSVSGRLALATGS